MKYEVINKGHRLEILRVVIDGDSYDYYPVLEQFEIGDNWDVYFSPTLNLEELKELKAFLDYIFEEVIE